MSSSQKLQSFPNTKTETPCELDMKTKPASARHLAAAYLGKIKKLFGLPILPGSSRRTQAMLHEANCYVLIVFAS
jgi:hypothetical protein